MKRRASRELLRLATDTSKPYFAEPTGPRVHKSPAASPARTPREDAAAPKTTKAAAPKPAKAAAPKPAKAAAPTPISASAPKPVKAAAPMPSAPKAFQATAASPSIALEAAPKKNRVLHELQRLATDTSKPYFSEPTGPRLHRTPVAVLAAGGTPLSVDKPALAPPPKAAARGRLLPEAAAATKKPRGRKAAGAAARSPLPPASASKATAPTLAAPAAVAAVKKPPAALLPPPLPAAKPAASPAPLRIPAPVAAPGKPAKVSAGALPVVVTAPGRLVKIPAAAAPTTTATSGGGSSPQPVKPWGSRPAIARIEVGTRYSEVATHVGTVYLAGQVPETTSSRGIKAQTAEVLALIDARLAAAGTDKTRILMATCYLTDIENDYDGFNAAWDAWAPLGHAPPRATVGVAGLADSSWLVEIAVVAAK
jgi:enamine deaminase RidA (YjgF/YER057c/UK114 family)